MGDAEENRTTTETYASLARDGRLVAVALVSFCATLGSNVASAALPAMSDGLGVGDTRIGLVMTVISLLAMLFVPFTGALADAFGHRRILLPSILGYGLAGSAIAFVGTFEAVLAVRGFDAIFYIATAVAVVYSGVLLLAVDEV